MKAKVYKNQYGSLFAVREKNGAPRLCCKAKDSEEWTVSAVLAACAGADATTADELQAVLDRAAEVKGWEPVESAPEPAAPAPAPLATPAPAAPAVFSYEGLDENTRQALRISEKMILEARQTFVTRVAEAVNIAHDALCSTSVQNLDTGKYESQGEDSFRAWCAYMGFTKSTAYNLLSVHKLLAGASAEEMEHLEAASPSLLYAAAKPSAPPPLVQAVKDGDITTHKQYQEAMQRLRDLEAERDELEAHSKAEADALRRQLDEARSAADGARMREGSAREAAHTYHVQLENAREQRDTLLDRQAEYLARIQELESRPVEVAVQRPGAEEIERWRAEGARDAHDELQGELADAKQEIATLNGAVESWRGKAKALQQRLEAAPATPTADDCQRLMDTFADTLDGFRAMIRQTFDRAQLKPETMERVTRRVRSTLESLSMSIGARCGYTDEKEDDPFAE